MKDLKRVLEGIVEEACRTLGGWRAKIVLSTSEGNPTDIVSVGFEDGLDVCALIRPDGISVQVMASGEPWYTEDAQKVTEVVNPAMLADGVRAFVCVPLTLADPKIGVMWIHYREPRQFLETEVKALQLYANQAAAAYDSAQWTQPLENLIGADDVQVMLQQIVEGQSLSMTSSATAYMGKDNFSWRYTAQEYASIAQELLRPLQDLDLEQTLTEASTSPSRIVPLQTPSMAHTNEERESPSINKTHVRGRRPKRSQKRQRKAQRKARKKARRKMWKKR